jgi:hypothetical protein
MLLGLTTRQVADLSKTIAAQRGRDELSVSHACLVQIENEHSVPGLFKLYSLSVIYGVPVMELFAHYVNMTGADHLHVALQHASTHLLSLVPREGGSHSTVARADPEQVPGKTTLLSPVDTQASDVRLLEFDAVHGGKYRYGMIGTSDYMMYPLIQPGSLVQIQDCQKPAPHAECRTEFDRPIYFIETRTAFLCSWCEMAGGDRLLAVPHPLSPCRVQQYSFPSEAEVIGRVSGLVQKLTPTGNGLGLRRPLLSGRSI